MPEYLSSNAGNSYPAAAIGAAVTASGSWGLAATWVEVVASVSVDEMVASVTSKWGAFTGSFEWEIEVGIGGAGAETTVAVFRGVQRAPSSLTGSVGTVRSLVPIDVIPTGSRVAVRARKSTTGTRGVNIGINTLPTAFVGGTVTTTTKPLQSLPSSAGGAAVTPNASAWVNSAWAELVASSASALLVNHLSVQSAASEQAEIDLGIGGAGSETVITTLKAGFNASGLPSVMRLPHLLDAIPISTRIAARLRKSGTNVSNWVVGLGAFEQPL